MLIIGTLESVQIAQGLILQRVFDEQLLQQDGGTDDANFHLPSERPLQPPPLPASIISNQVHPSGFFPAEPLSCDDIGTIKIVIPSKSSGVLIGHQGSNIKSLQELSGGAKIQLDNRNGRDDEKFHELVKERIVSITGE